MASVRRSREYQCRILLAARWEATKPSQSWLGAAPACREVTTVTV